LGNAIIDSLFLELGIDTTRFSTDQQRALARIKEFEQQAKRSARGARDGIKTVGEAFRELAKDSRIGASADRLDSLATKLRNLGIAARVSGGPGAPIGVMAKGLGALLSPTSLGIAVIGALGLGMWKLNDAMTASNATLYRQAQLSGMNAQNLWAWGEAAKTVGANPNDISGGIAGLQTAVLGMGIGAGSATAQLIALSRLGVGYNFQGGVNIAQLFSRVHQLAAAQGFQNLGALRALTGPVMNDAMWALATNPNLAAGDLQKQIRAMESVKLGTTLQESLKSQEVLGRLGIAKDVLAETAYGDAQGLLQAVVTILTSLLSVTNKILDLISGFFGKPAAPSPGWRTGYAPRAGSLASKQAAAMQSLIRAGISPLDAAAMVGNMTQESTMDPFAVNAGHVGLMQWDATRQARFAKMYGYRMGSPTVAANQQVADQLAFALKEPEFQRALRQMGLTSDLLTKTYLFKKLDEIVNDNSLDLRFVAAQQALGAMADAAVTKSSTVSSSVTSHTRIDNVNVSTQATDAQGMAAGARAALSSHPLILPPIAQQMVLLGTRAMA